jgi:hypothetical protein
MDQAQTSPVVDVQKVAIDNISVDSPIGSHGAQMWIALTPVLTVLITAIGIVFTFCFQIYQTRQESLQKEDSDWRSAIGQVSGGSGSSAIGAFEMQSFLSDAKYHSQARSISAAILPTIRNKYEFDVAFFGLVADTTFDTQNDIITVANNIANELRSQYAATQKILKDDPRLKSMTLEDFVMNPDSYIDDATQSEELDKVLVATWELDSVTHGLSSLWGHSGKSFAVPKNADFSGLIFMNNDFSGIDFSGTSMKDAYFIGSCKVDANRLPSDARAPECVQN